MTAAERLAAIRARVEAATPGPWGYPFPRKNRITTAAYIDVTEADWGGEGLREYSLGCTEDRNAWRAEDAEFIAHARDDVPFLLAELRRRDDALDAVLALTEDEWGSRADEVERCPSCRRKWSKHTDMDESCFSGASALAGYIGQIRAAIACILGDAK